jgi:hypothetical protein
MNMNMNNRAVFLIVAALAGAAGAALATGSYRRRGRTERELQHRSDVKDWENEGGNLAPATLPLAAQT